MSLCNEIIYKCILTFQQAIIKLESENEKLRQLNCELEILRKKQSIQLEEVNSLSNRQTEHLKEQAKCSSDVATKLSGELNLTQKSMDQIRRSEREVSSNHRCNE